MHLQEGQFLPWDFHPRWENQWSLCFSLGSAGVHGRVGADRSSDHGTKAAQMPRLESIPTSTSQTTPIRTLSIWTARSHKAHQVHPRRLMPNPRPATDLRSEPPPPRAEPAHRFPAIRVPSSRHSGWVHPPFHWLCTSSILTVCEGGSRPLGGRPRRLAAWTPPVWVRPIHASSTPTPPHTVRVRPTRDYTGAAGPLPPPTLGGAAPSAPSAPCSRVC